MHGLLVEEESENYWSVNLQTQFFFFFFFSSKEGIILYLQKIINHQSGTVEDFLSHNEKRFNIQLFINVELGWTNLSQDLIVGQGKAQSTTIRLIWRYRHVVMLQKQDDQSLYRFSAVKGRGYYGLCCCHLPASFIYIVIGAVYSKGMFGKL